MAPFAAPPHVSWKDFTVSLTNEELRSRLAGIVPPLTTPFDRDGNLIVAGVREQIDFMRANGVRAVVAGGSTGEGHTLDREDFAALMRATADACASDVTLVAGLIVNSTREAQQRTQILQGMDVAALQLTPVHYLFKCDVVGSVQHYRTIHEASGIPILIYNVIPWKYLGVDMMLQIMREVPGVAGIKQSAGDLKSVSDLLARMAPHNLVLSGIDALLYPAFALGVHGAITALTAAVPGVCVKLWNAVQAGDYHAALDLHRRLNALWDLIPHDNLPAYTKYIQHRQGLSLYHGRAPMQGVDSSRAAAIDAALKNLPV
ncbi:MAG: dihydrodipicolinate synthase family protein [Gemmatimonadaceae bacterium]|nr:dihydrodipicolinate synthase family protein [Gemmatimonadaceae bacterium]